MTRFKSESVTANGHISPKLELRAQTEVSKSGTEVTIKSEMDPSSSFASDMKAMYRDKTFADTMLVCGKVEIPCHSVVLAHRSGNFLFCKGSYIVGCRGVLQLGGLVAILLQLVPLVEDVEFHSFQIQGRCNIN